MLRDSAYCGRLHWSNLIVMARNARGDDPEGHRAEAIRLMEIARDLGDPGLSRLDGRR